MLKKLYRNRLTDQKSRNQLWATLTTNYFQKFIHPKDIVLDIPCGYCEFINNIHCSKKLAADINPDSQTFAKKDVEFILCPSTKILLKNRSVNKIFVSNFFEHIDKLQISKTIKEFKRVLKDEGEVLILQPNIRFCWKDYWMFFDHITPIDDRALEEIFTTLGFKLKYKITRFLPYTTKSRFPKSSFLIKLYLRLKPIWYVFGKQSFLIFKK